MIAEERISKLTELAPLDEVILDFFYSKVVLQLQSKDDEMFVNDGQFEKSCSDKTFDLHFECSSIVFLFYKPIAPEYTDEFFF